MVVQVQDGTKLEAGAKPKLDASETPQTFTQEQVDKLIKEARTATMADVGRLKAEADKALKAAQAAQKRLDDMRRAQESAEEEAARDEPDKLRILRAERARREAESNLEQARTQLEEATSKLTEREARDKEIAKERTAHEIASRLQVDPSKLAKLAKYTDGSPETIEEIARDLPKLSASSLKPDSGRSSGGSTRSALEIRQAYIRGEYSNNPDKYVEDLKALGAKP